MLFCPRLLAVASVVALHARVSAALLFLTDDPASCPNKISLISDPNGEPSSIIVRPGKLKLGNWSLLAGEYLWETNSSFKMRTADVTILLEYAGGRWGFWHGGDRHKVYPSATSDSCYLTRKDDDRPYCPSPDKAPWPAAVLKLNPPAVSAEHEPTWTPSFSTLGGQTCAAITFPGDTSQQHTQELASGLKHWSSLTQFTVDISDAEEWDEPEMEKVFANIEGLSITDFTLWAPMSQRAEWRDGATMKFTQSVPKATSLSLYLNNTGMSNTTILALLKQFPIYLSKLKLNLQGTHLNENFLDGLLTDIRDHSLLAYLDDIELDVSQAPLNRDFSNEGKLALFKALRDRRMDYCSFICDPIDSDWIRTNVSKADQELVEIACKGEGNCANPEEIIPGVRNFYTESILAVLLVLVVGLLLCVRQRRKMNLARQALLGEPRTSQSSEMSMQPVHRQA